MMIALWLFMVIYQLKNPYNACFNNNRQSLVLLGIHVVATIYY